MILLDLLGTCGKEDEDELDFTDSAASTMRLRRTVGFGVGDIKSESDGLGLGVLGSKVSAGVGLGVLGKLEYWTWGKSEEYQMIEDL